MSRTSPAPSAETEQEIRRRVGSAEFVEEPYPTYHFLREHAPVWKCPTGSYIFTRYEDCTQIYRDWKSFGQVGRGVQEVSPEDASLEDVLEAGTLMAHTLVGTDPPTHTRLRKLISHMFSPKQVERLRGRIEQIAHELIDQFESRGEVDLMEAYARPLPAMLITEMLGVDYDDAETWEPWADAIHSATAAAMFLPEQQERAQALLTAARDARREESYYFRDLIAARREEPGDDIITLLAEVEESGDRLDEIELLATLVVILGGGHHTSVSLIGNGAYALLANPDQLQLLKEDPSLIDGTLEETLRLDPTLQMSGRSVKAPRQIGGVDLAPGDAVSMVIAAANRDPEVFPDPDRFDIRRENADKHIAFGLGIHHCIGHALARAEGGVALEVLFARLPDLRLTEESPPHDGWWNLRGFEQLPVAWSPR